MFAVVFNSTLFFSHSLAFVFFLKMNKKQSKLNLLPTIKNSFLGREVSLLKKHFLFLLQLGRHSQSRVQLFGHPKMGISCLWAEDKVIWLESCAFQYALIPSRILATKFLLNCAINRYIQSFYILCFFSYNVYSLFFFSLSQHFSLFSCKKYLINNVDFVTMLL